MPINEKQYPIFKDFQHEKKKEILRYIELVYHKDSPLAKEVFVIEDLKYRAAIDAGLNPDNPDIKEIFALENREVSALIDCYLTRVQNNYEWTNLMTNLELFGEYTSRVRQPINTELEEDKQLAAFEKKAKLRQELASLQVAIEKGFSNIYKGFEDEKSKGRLAGGVSPETFGKK